MSQLPNCPKCDSEFTYENGPVLACPDCGHEWTPEETAAELKAEDDKNIRVIDSSHDGHNIDCKVDGLGQIKLKSEFVKKL